MYKKFVLILTAMFACSLVMTGCEAENPGEPLVNQAPDTYISEASPGNTTTIAFYGTDKDGFVDEFAYRWDTDNTWTETTELQIQFEDVFTSATEMRTFFVRGIDDQGMEDPTPAEISLTATNALPETRITGGPEFGREAGEDVTFSFEGIDAESDGEIMEFEYTMDDLDNWESTSVEYPHAVYLGLSSGAHTFYVRAVDNLGGADPTPAQVAFVVKGGNYRPTLVNLSPLDDGGGWFSGVDLTFAWDAITAGYYGTLAEAAYSYALDDESNYNNNAVDALASGWNSETSIQLTPTEGSHTFYLKVRDTAGGVSLMSIGFNAAAPSFDQGILVVNGVSTGGYGAEITDRLAAGTFWGSLEVDFWDLFGTMGAPSATLPAGVDYAGGGGPVPPTEFAKYSTVLWLGNNFSGDLAHWQLSPILPYLTAGGNIVLASRLAADFLPQQLTDYLSVGWREGDAAGASDGSTISECIAVFPGLIDMPFDGGQSLVSIFSGGGFLDSGDDNTVTNWDGTSGYTKSSLTHTLLFAHRSSDYDASYTFGFVRGLSAWAHPNFPFSSESAGDEFPTPGTIEAQGNFVLIGGRNYRYEMAATTANFEFILRNMCGEQ